MIGVLGCKGRLGRELVKQGCFPLEIDVTDPIALKTIPNNIETIINCASYTKVDRAEGEMMKCYLTNAFSPSLIVENALGRKIVHISTDYIFKGDVGLYRETDIPDPVNVYGWSKFWGEIPIRRFANNLIIRTTILYDNSEKDNFVKSVYAKLKNGESISLPEIYGNPTWIPHLTEGILKAIEKNVCGILNIVGRDWVSRYDLGLKIADKFGFDRSLVVKGIGLSDAKRGDKYGLNVEKADILGIPIYSLDSGLEEFKKSVS